MKDEADRRLDSGLVTKLLVGSGFLPVWILTGALVVVAAAIAPDALSATAFSAVLPLAAFLAVASLGEMLVIMTGGIDLSIPGTLTLAAYLLVGVSGSNDGGLVGAIVVVVLVAVLIGLVNGFLIGVAGLNPLIVTLAVGQIVLGFTMGYSSRLAHESGVPGNLSDWATNRFLGVSVIFWVGVALTVALVLLLRGTTIGRRFQAVGANPRAAWMSGIHVRTHVVFAYIAASIFYAIAGVLLAAFIRSPSLDLGAPYLLGPIAAVVIGGASLAGGSASATSTFAAAFALTLLNQVMRVLGLTLALQYVVFGVTIVVGMVISGDRIVGVIGGILQRPGRRARRLSNGALPDDAGQEHNEVTALHG